MSKHTKENPPIVSRNQVSIPLSLTQFGKTSDKKGQSFWTMEATAANQESVFKFMGLDTVTTVVSRFLRRVAMDIHSDNTDTQSGVIDMDGVIADWADFTSGAATMSDLEDQIGELVDQVQTIIVDPDYSTDDNDQPVNPARYIELTEQVKGLSKKISPLKLQLKEIQKKHAAAAAKRAEAKAKKEAASLSKTTTAT